jgi:hypothetical protein
MVILGPNPRGAFRASEAVATKRPLGVFVPFNLRHIAAEGIGRLAERVLFTSE